MATDHEDADIPGENFVFHKILHVDSTYIRLFHT